MPKDLLPFLNTSTPFYLQKNVDDEAVLLFQGKIHLLDKIAEIPIKTYTVQKTTYDSVSLIPFSQAKERGFDVHDSGEKIKTLVIDDVHELSVEALLQSIDNVTVNLENISHDVSKKDYKDTIARIIRDEIGMGQGANFVIPRIFTAKITTPLHQSVLSIFRSLLVNEFGAYSTFLFFDGKNYVIGASPERHISKRHNDVMMNPISGTFRKNETNDQNFVKDFTTFLKDKKEIFELFMVTDEELKIMCRLCEQGGAIIGPHLKEMSKLIHTEYLLIGQSDKTIHQLLKDSMFAPTVTGSPVQNAFRVIKRYEKQGRGYYASVIALIGREKNGDEILEAPITIRTLEIDPTGQLCGRAGATLVKGSNPEHELKETDVKISGIINSIAMTGKPPVPLKSFDKQIHSQSIQTLLQKRNFHMSRFWIEPQNKDLCNIPIFQDKKVLIIDAEDDFSRMLKRMISHMGATVKWVSLQDYDEGEKADLVIAGPGPGNPTDFTDPKMQKLKTTITTLLARKQPLFAECLSHQMLCHLLGFEVIRKQQPLQGTQEDIHLFGQNVRVGFYNTFAGLMDKNILDKGRLSSKAIDLGPIEAAFDDHSGEIHALKGPHFYSCQFHPESILTPNGYNIIVDILSPLLSNASPQALRD